MSDRRNSMIYCHPAEGYGTDMEIINISFN